MTPIETKVKIYTKDPCPYCVRAIQLMNENHIAFEEIDLTEYPEEIIRIKNETGWRTVPIIMIDNHCIGGFEDLKKLNFQGKLEHLKRK